MLEVHDIEAGYGGKPVLQGVSLRVGDGEVVAVLGGNGSGKSTTLRAIIGLIRLRSGRVILNGRDISRLPVHRIVTLGMTMVPEGRQVFSKLSVEDNLKLGAFLVGDEDLISPRLRTVYDLFPRLQERCTQNAGSLSGGEQQMLAFGRALMVNPSLLLMDEPSMGLAPLVLERIYEAVKRVNEGGTSLLLVEQNARKALRVSHRAYVLQAGQVVMEGRSSELETDERVRKIYLGEIDRAEAEHSIRRGV